MNDVSFFPVARSMRLDVMGRLHDPVKEVMTMERLWKCNDAYSVLFTLACDC